MISRLTDQLSNDKPVHMAWLGMRDPQLVAAVAQEAFSAVLLDAQHGFHDEVSFLDCIPHIVAAGKSPLARIPVGRWDLCERLLDFGALGIVAPMINTKKDAEAFASSVKYPKTGRRSYGPRHAATLYGLSTNDYVVQANENTLSFAQIETLEAYENLDQILSVDGIDGVLMGPSDFAISVTGEQVPDPYGSESTALVKDIAKRTRASGKIAAAFTISAEHSNLVYSMGYRLISVAMDGSLISAGAKSCFEGLEF